MRIPTIKNRPRQSPLKLSISQINLSLRTANFLESADIFTVEELLCQKSGDLLKIKNLGHKALDEIFKALKEVGFEKEKAA